MTEPTILGGRYEIGDVLGRGGMAEVHAGRDVRLGRQVAVKMLRADLARDPSFQARFRREAQSAASLNHPAVVAVYDTGEDVGAPGAVPYIVMEYVEGSTLRDLLNSGRRLLPERALEIMSGVLDALDYSHRHGIVHRDIKPANVMLTATGDVKVMDFGIARAIADTSATMTQTSAIMGTAQYLSPEQARGETVDARSDLYSAGCLLFELLTGRPPFVGDSPVAVAYQHVREDAPQPSAIDPDVPAAADAIVHKALVKDREQRYQTAAEMRADIERALAGRPVEAPSAVASTQLLTPIVPTAVRSTTTTVGPAAYEPEEDRGRSGSRVFGYLLLILGVLAVFALAALAGREYFSNEDGGATTVDVPALTALTEAEATAAILAEGLTVGTITPEFSEEEVGRVIDQDPEADTPVAPNTPVNLFVSSGQEQTTVPTLVGRSRAEAEQALRDAGLELGDLTPRDSLEDEDQVLEASQQPGTEVAVNSTVDLVVASGSNTVPTVTTQTRTAARSALQQAGFEVEITTTQDGSVEPDTVLSQDPAGEQSLRLGATVTIVVAEAPDEEPEPTPSPEPTGSPPGDGVGGD